MGYSPGVWRESVTSASRHALRGGRRRAHGQSMIEFALCAPVVFAVIFGVTNGGLFMFAKNTVARAANVGAVTEAADGVVATADTDTLAAMRGAGLSSSSLIGVKWVKIEAVTYSSSTGYQPVTGCTDGSGSVPCANQYKIDGTPMWNYSTCTTDPTYHCPPWPPSARSVHASSASIIRLTIHYTFTFLAATSTFTLDEVNIFRLEPKDL